ncbi:adenylyl-sulfate kinase [Paenibacillus chitinolyticus]|uniref:Adenylyl-sulfate kinase n=1 Tax=Paenibacillus chitinolyticus TaxID=79263 RepID=A0A410WY93_9BACL|nr:adenylyl-sulfate kinase [Paenibacillus chitinolyticus]MCY9590645.1 adenylyl-sulfate kinase [Paenibacillus chitinolyticus]MCY9596360.1 adenylyl-sulfate kinase [Paenibacillus chitinolyticus]QAV19384.1 adenylyl-sulfate kinase [Paenibacillus chitinolyticus]
MIEKSEWNRVNGHKGKVLWFSGLSGSGKSTLAAETERELFRRGIRCVVLDGDQLRSGINRDLGFTDQDRNENLRRAAEIAALFLSVGFVVLVPMISPSAETRNTIRQRFGPEDYTEVYVKCSLETCEQRDPKGLYRKARSGLIKQFTGIDSLYEPPLEAELTVDTEHEPTEHCVQLLVDSILCDCQL